ncbi:MAG: DUF2605 family protein [Cyanobacteriota bacterium]|nr:DUF2605 family protein [Cyanobacteriota bacterium]
MDSPSSLPPSSPQPAGQLLDQLLDSLLVDFRFWFARGLVLLDHCPDRVMPPDQRAALAEELQQAQRLLQAASSLRQAAPAPMALEMETLAPWHQLVLRVWNLSAALRLAGVPLPEREGPPSP